MTSIEKRIDLTRFAWLSIGAAVVTILLKLTAYWLTNSVGLLSDALESVVNLVAAIVALIALSIASRPADEEFTYGYSKVEFFSSGFEGGMILLAAVSIASSAIPRLLNPQPLEQVGVGLAVSISASLVNLLVAQVLERAGKRYGSITLRADSRHLMTDVVTTVGVILGVFLVKQTGWLRLDPFIALLVAGNIIFTGFTLLRHSAMGLMDVSLPPADIQEIKTVLKTHETDDVKFHALRTRTAAARSFVSMHILVPGSWTVTQAHQLAEAIETELRRKLEKVAIFTHIEPVDDPISFQDTNLERE